jgi:acid phosphatase type 7
LKPIFIVLASFVLVIVSLFLQVKAGVVTAQPQLDTTPTFSLYLPLVLVPEPTPEPTPDPTPEPTPEPTPDILIVVGDICKNNYPKGPDYTGNCNKTGDLVRGVLAANPGAQVQTLGDNVNNDKGHSLNAEYQMVYDPNWGSFLNVTHAALGNHDTFPAGGTGPYLEYFGAAAGPRREGYYSYDIGTSWHVVVLNSECAYAGGCLPGSEQYIWLQDDLAANTRQCVLAVWHEPRWTSISNTSYQGLSYWWDLLYQYKVDIVANGHIHWYERFDLIDPNEDAAADGIREFVVGTGGAPGQTSSNPLDPNEAIRIQHDVNGRGVYGVLELALFENSYSWNLLPAAGFSFTDSGTTACH